MAAWVNPALHSPQTPLFVLILGLAFGTKMYWYTIIYASRVNIPKHRSTYVLTHTW